MSPTAAMLILVAGRAGSTISTGSVAGTASSGAGGSGGGDTGAVVVQAASDPSTRAVRLCRRLFTEPDAYDVDLRGAQAAAQDVEFFEVVRRTDAYAVIRLVVDRYALDRRFDTLQGEFGTAPVCVLESSE
jgi:hypothetical protein